MDFTDEQELRIRAVLAEQLGHEFITDEELLELEHRAFDIVAERMQAVDNPCIGTLQ